MDNVRIKKLEEKEALLRDTFEDALLSLERDSTLSIEDVRLLKSLATIWLACDHLIKCEKMSDGVKDTLHLKT